MNSLADGICQQIEHLVDLSIYSLRNDPEHGKEGSATSGEELLQIWSANYNRLPSPFRDKLIADLRSCIVDLDSAFFGFGDYSYLIVSMLQKCLSSEEIAQLIECSFTKPDLDNASYAKLLAFVLEVLQSKNNDLNMKLTQLFLSSNATVKFDRLDDNKIYILLVQIHLKLLPPTNILHLQQFYPILADKLNNEVLNLRGCVGDEMSTSTSRIRASERTLNLLLSAIYPLCTIRNSFLIMALSPNLIELCLRKLMTTELWFFQNFPILHKNILSVAFTFAKTHDFFVATSSLNKINKFVGESPSSVFCQEQINTLGMLLTRSELLTSDTLEFLIDWLFLLVGSLGSGIQTICEKEELVSLRKVVLFLYFNEDITTPTKLDNIADNLRVFEIMTGFGEEESQLFIEKLNSSLKLRKSIETCHQLWKRIPAVFLTKLFLLTNCKITLEKPKLNQSGFFERVSQIKTFLFLNNKNAFDQRFYRANDQNFSKPQWDALLNLFASDVTNGTPFLPSTNEIALLTIDELNKIRNEVQPVHNSYYNSNNRQNFERKEREHLRVSCLLSLIEQLDRSVLERFYTNDLQKLDHKKFRFCAELGLDTSALFGLYNCAYKAGQYEWIIFFSTQFLTQFEDRMFNGELLVVVCWMVRAFVELKDGQSIYGLKLWLERTFGAHLAWLDYAGMLADGSIENALTGLDALSVEYLDNRDIVTETIFMLRERGLRQLLDPSLCHQYAPAFYSQFMRPIGAPPMLSTEMLNPAVVLELSSWNQFDRLRTPVAPPNYGAAATYNLFSSFDQVESNLSSMQKIFSNFGAQSVPDVLTCLHESEKHLLNLSRNLADFGLSSSVGSRLFPLHVVIQQFRDIVFSTDTINSARLNELLLYNGKLSTFARLEIAQKISNWIEKFFGTSHLRFTELSPSFVKLSRKTGNLRLASSFLNKASRGILNQNTLKNNFGELSNLSEALKLEILRNDPSNVVGLQQKFFAFADLTASHADIYLASNADNSNRVPEPIVSACLKLGSLVHAVPVKRDLFTNKSPKSAFWTQLNNKLNVYQTNCSGERFEKLLSGAFLSIPDLLSTQMPKAHKRLSDWALGQISIDTSFGVDALRLMPSEEVALHALCGLTEKNRETFLRFVGQNDTLSEFQEQIQNVPEFMNDTTALNGVQSKSFEQLWDALKARQHLFYSIATESAIRFLKNSESAKPADQVSVVLNLINLLVSHPNLFSQQETTSGWIEQTNVRAWVRIVQPLFAYLNHQDSFVRETFKSLIEQIGNTYPHAVCYPTFVRANQLTEQNDEEEPSKVVSNQNTLTSEICAEIVENLRSTRPQLVTDLRMFIDEFQKVVLLTSEKWLFVLNHLEQGILRSCKQIEKERAQLLEVMQSQEVLNNFVRQATTTVFSNALDTIEDLYRSTCEGNSETVERQRFVRNFKELIKRTIKSAKQSFEQPNPNFEVFRKLMSRLSNSISMQSQYRIKLTNLSPTLATCTHLSVPIPGQELTEIDDGVITIQSVDPYISMLPTKTRPKKIKFVGSDGKQYSFLCKGQEDLRVDEQISNMFKLCNYMFDASKLTRQNPQLPYNIRSYTVTPISPRSGLIQWVKDPVSIYSIYRSWRASKLNQYRSERNVLAEKTLNLEDNPLVRSPERKHSEPVFDLELLSGHEERVDQIFDFMAQQQLSQNSAAELELSPKQETLKQTPRLLRHVPDQTAQRLKMSPIELYTFVLKSKFNEKNISMETTKNRKNWPSDVLLEVYNELSTLVPSSLIADELWLKSSNSSEWWRKIQRFGRSTAISSVIGALLGIGDRHLDNLLVDFSTGQIVHVDFNVAYNKGKNLRVPELVPFRLTQNIIRALGPTKFEGNFRDSSEKTMELLRTNSTVITSMLNTFVHDPLLEWIPASNKFNMGNLNIGISLVVYDEDRRDHFAATTALSFLHLYLDVFAPRLTELREELETALLATCRLFTEMNNYRLNNGPELHHFNDERISVGTRLKNAIVAHQSMMRPLKPLFRILTRVDLRFSNFMKTYRSMFSTPLVNGHRLLANEKNIDYLSCIKNFQTSLVNAQSVYTQLVELRNITNLMDSSEAPMSAISCEDVSLAGSIFQEALTANHNEKGTNEIAAEIVHNCQQFLKGVDGEKSDNLMSVGEHVNSLIMSATDKQNLSKMFEGWCPWI